MSCTKETSLQIKFLNNQLNPNKTRRQDALFGIRYSALNPYANKVTWNIVKANWNKLLESYGGALSFGNLVSDLSRKFNTQNDLDEVIRTWENFKLI